ncbi:hypothetical protein AB4277_13215 [Vibrio splendidus]
MYTILIKNQMDKFTVTAARDALMSSTDEFKNKNDARKALYRQIYQFERKGWLISSGEGRSKKYSVTETFKKLNVTSNQARSTSSYSDSSSTYDISVSEVMVLRNEKREVEAELEITLSEIERYKILVQRFPKLSKVVPSLIQKANERSAELLGNLNALSNVLKSLSEVQSSC